MEGDMKLFFLRDPIIQVKGEVQLSDGGSGGEQAIGAQLRLFQRAT